jgi:hypothetical protein
MGWRFSVCARLNAVRHPAGGPVEGGQRDCHGFVSGDDGVLNISHFRIGRGVIVVAGSEQG